MMTETEMTGEQCVEMFGFNPDVECPERDFWYLEDGRLYIHVPFGVLPGQLHERENYDRFTSLCDGIEFHFKPLYVAATKSDLGVVPDLRTWLSRVLHKFFKASC